MNDETKHRWLQTLESLRFDVVRHDPLLAHKEYNPHQVAEVTLDESGQIRLVLTRQIQETKSEKRKSRAGREYQTFVERNVVTIVNYRLSHEDDLSEVLTEMESVSGRQ
jgi:uncharacterized protein YacL (UPF0231 family)